MLGHILRFTIWRPRRLSLTLMILRKEQFDKILSSRILLLLFLVMDKLWFLLPTMH